MSTSGVQVKRPVGPALEQPERKDEAESYSARYKDLHGALYNIDGEDLLSSIKEVMPRLKRILSGEVSNE